jgi:hypothetical protein
MSQQTQVLCQSRAVRRAIAPGSMVACASCREPIRFKAKVRAEQAICNVYENGKWVRVEHHHDACYTKAGEPYGPATT